LALEKGAESLFIAGDLFDAVNPPPQLIFHTIQALKRKNLSIFVLAGNHDRASDQKGDHALGPLSSVHKFNVVETPEIIDIGDKTVAAIPFLPGHAPDYLEQVVRELGAPEGSVLCLHLGVYDDKTPDYLRNSHDAVPASLVFKICREHGFPAAVVGNWHERRVWKGKDGTIIQQVGALAPTGWDNEGIKPYGGVAFWTGDRIVMETAPGPRFLKLKSKKGLKSLQTLLETVNGEADPSLPHVGCSFYVRAVAKKGEEDEIRSKIEQLRSNAGESVFPAFEVIADAKKAEEAAKQAAISTKTAGENLADAVSAYVKNMDAPMSFKDEITRRALSFLNC
jgi:DNA repair exonuclease SbcCD nuclease subunit